MSFASNVTWAAVILATSFFLLRQYLLPLLIRLFSTVRVAAISPISVKGLEWRDENHVNSVVPSLRLERAGWALGGCGRESPSFLVLRVEGVSLRIKKGTRKQPKPKRPKGQPGRWTAIKNRILSSALHLAIHHCSYLTTIISLQIFDIRIIFDDVEGVELTLKEYRMGMEINFETHAESQPFGSSRVEELLSPGIERTNPLLSQTYDLSPPPSPVNFTGFAFPSENPPEASEEHSAPKAYRPSKMATTVRRRASQFQSGVSTATVQVWSRFIARAHGSVSFKIVLVDIAVILPNVNPAHPDSISLKPSMPNMRNGLSNKTSSQSLRADRRPELPRSNSFVSIQSFNSILRPRTPRYALPVDGGYEKILEVEGDSRANLSLGFGPKKGLLAEDTLQLGFDMAKLHGSLGAAEKLIEMLDTKKKEIQGKSEIPTKPKPNQWSPTATPRIVMRALESVSVGFTHITISHHLTVPSLSPLSTRSSATDLTDVPPQTPPEAEFFTLSLDVSRISCRISAADASNNERARNAFGTNTSSESKIRGVGFRLEWQVIELQCLAPGETSDQKSQLLAVRQADFDGFSSWRPQGWTRNEMLFSSDPNLALVVMRGNANSIDVAADVQLLNELHQAWNCSRPDNDKAPKVARVKGPSQSLPPRIRMVLEVGHIMAIVADRVSEQRTTLSLSSDGFNIGCFTNFSDIIGRRKDKATAKAAFKEEERLRSRRENIPEDYTQPESMWKPDVRRHYGPPANIPDDLSISLEGNASISVEPITLHMSLSGREERDQTSYHLASIGRIHGTLSGDVLGRQDIIPVESSSLDPTSLVANLNIGIDHGIRAHLFEPAVVNALCAMGEAHSPTAIHPSSSDNGSLLDRLPAGLSARLSLGRVEGIIGHVDPNPKCELGLIKGVKIESFVAIEYSYFRHKSQAAQSRHPLIANERRKLQLRDDITTQALAFHNYLEKHGGQAALLSLIAMDAAITPLFNISRLMKRGGQNLKVPPTPIQRDDDTFVGWDFRHRPNLNPGEFANNVPPLEISDTDQAQRPLIRLPHSTFNWLIQKAKVDAKLEHKVTGKVMQTHVVCDLSHVYSLLLASLTVKAVNKAWKRPTSRTPTTSFGVSAEIALPTITIHLALPLKEQVFLLIKSVTFDRFPGSGISVGVEQILVYVPSPRVIGSWEDLVRIKRLSVKGHGRTFIVAAEALAIRIPASYQMNRLILNLNVSIKASKLLMTDLGGHGFETVKVPDSEAPKRIPKLHIKVHHVVLEAADNPIETVLGLIARAGIAEQEIRNNLIDTFNRKKALMTEDTDSSGDESHGPTHRLTKKATVAEDEALTRLRWWMARSWTRRIRAAKSEQRRREDLAKKNTQNLGPDTKIPIRIVNASVSAPLFRAVFEGFDFAIEDPGMSRVQIIEYMAEASTPFRPDVAFSLMVPTQFSWKMDSAVIKLRDYPLPLVRIQPVESGDRPAWLVETTFIIAEELAGRDSYVLIPCPVIPAGCGDFEAQPFVVQIAKTIMPVKTYARPHIKIGSDKTTEFTWGNSYQPAIQDFMKVIERVSHPPRDPSPRVGFWDKFRLILHWKVIAEFTGPAHLHLKGSSDPYMVNGVGAGFALAWRGHTRLEIAQPNKQYETIQMSADELLIAIPDLSALHDGAAIGNDAKRPSDANGVNVDGPTKDQGLVERRYTKPCARFTNGVRVGFGFKLERTCRPWNCTKCGATDNLMHRQCRLFTFKNHQDVILRSAEFVGRESEKLGRQFDSYEGFRSDYIHFSISLEAPDEPKEQKAEDAEMSNSLHFTPMAFAHFYAWWNLFDHTTSLPIQQGRLFPDSPPPSKKFGRSIATIKYRFNLAPVYVSHMYGQVSQDMWTAGKAQSLGLKARFGHFKADAHQRAQEKTVKHEALHRVKTVTHKAFYAADLILSDIKVKGLRVEFTELATKVKAGTAEAEGLPKASELSKDLQVWFNFFDFIDADRKPLDRNPRVEMVDIGDCPQISFCKRVKAKKTSPDDRDDGSLEGTEDDSGMEVESSKFGHEKSHICYLGAAPGVADVQTKITWARLKELEAMVGSIPEEMTRERTITLGRMNTLRKHLEVLSDTEKRHIDDDTFQSQEPTQQSQVSSQDVELTFQDTIHVHCPRIFFNNASRNMVFKYWYSFEDRKRMAYTSSHTSLRGVREGIRKREERLKNAPRSFWTASGGSSSSELAHDMLKDLVSSLQDSPTSSLFGLPADINLQSDLRIPQRGLPKECAVKPKTRILVLKPQIALRSEVDVNAVVLLAVEEISFRGFQILDTTAYDEVTGDVLNRNYVILKGLQAFYPCEASLQRAHPGQGAPHGLGGLDFVPLEIFLDVRSEATDYDRIVLKSDIAISMDKFNHLRLPRGLDWPAEVHDNGLHTEHLRLHQDLTTVIIPRLTLSATSKHYTALYNVVTDLIMYKDPEHRHRAERIDSFIYAFDQKDRDPEKLLAELDTLQQTIRQLQRLLVGYEANVDLLTEGGKAELLKIRTDLTQGCEQLLTVFEAISANHARDEAKAAMKSSSRIDVRAGNIAWQMLNENFKPLIKLDIQKTIFSSNGNKDGSMDGALVINDLLALNSNSDAVFPEVVVRYESQGYRKKGKDAFASVCWSILSPVGGITIIRDLSASLHPVRFKIERVVGNQIKHYIFNEATTRKKAKEEANHQSETTLHRTRSNTSLATNGNGVGASSPHGSGAETPNGRHDPKFTMVPSEDAAEMKRRASSNKTFIRISFASTGLVFSYKRDPSRHKVITLPDCVDLKFRLPELIYENKVWGPRDIFDQIQKDVRNYAWSQGGDLFTQVLKKTSLFRTKKAFKHLSSAGTDMPRSSSHNPSKLNRHVEASPSSGESNSDLTRVLSNHAKAATATAAATHNGLSRLETNTLDDFSLSETLLDSSNGNGFHHPAGSVRSKPTSPASLSGSIPSQEVDEDDDDDDGEKEKEANGRRRVKGLLGKLRKARMSGSLARDSGSQEVL